MGSRSDVVDEEYMEEVKDKGENETWRKGQSTGATFSKKWANERNFETNSEEYKSDVLDQTLSKFYTFKIQ